MNSKYLNYSLGVKGLAFIPSIVAFLSFGMLVWFYGRDEATAVVSAPSEVDGIVVDQWDYEEKPSDQGNDITKLPSEILKTSSILILLY